MHWYFTPDLSILGIAAIISLGLAIYAFPRRTLPGVGAFFWLMLLMFDWTTGYLFELAAPELSIKLFWVKVEYPGIAFIPLTWLVLAVQFSQREKSLPTRRLAALTLVPTITVLAIWTNEAHGLMYQRAVIVSDATFSRLDVTYGMWFWVNAGYAYLLMLSGIILLFQTFRRSARLYRRQSLTLLIGAVIPLIWNLLYLLRLSPITHLDLTPFAFTLSGLLIAWGLFRYHIFDVVPVARDTVIENMREGVVVLDRLDRVVDINPAAQALLRRPLEAIIGQTVDRVFEMAPQLVQRYRSVWEAHDELVIGEGPARRYFDLRVSPLYDQRQQATGRLFVWSDVTARKQIEETLRRRDAILEAVSFAARQFLTTPSWAQSIQEVLARLGQATGVSRVYLFENFSDENAVLCVRQRYEWVTPGITPQIDNEALQHLPYQVAGFSRWENVLGQGAPVYGLVRQFPDSERGILMEQDIQSIIVMPIFVKDDWWGFIGFDECSSEWEWSQPEIDALRAAADTLGAAIQSEQIEATLRRQLAELRVLNAVATAGAEATGVDSLIERATQIIGDTSYPDNFGILLLDESAGCLRPHPSYRLREDKHLVLPVMLGQGITGRTAMDGRPRRVGDVARDPGYLQIDALTRSELCVPLKVGERLIGVINAESLQPDAFTEADERLLTTLAGQLATAIDRLRAQSAEYRRARQLAIINELAGEMTGLLDVQNLCATVTQRLHAAFGYFNVHIFTADHVRKELVLQAVARPHSVVQAGQYRQAFGHGLIGRAAQSGQIALAGDTRQDPDFFEIEERYVLSELAIPLKVGEQVIGVLNVESEQFNAFDASEVAMLTTVADQFAVTLEKARLFVATREQAELMARLASLGEALNRQLTVSEVAESIGAGALALNRADRVAIYLRMEDDTVRVAWAHGLSPAYLDAVTTHLRDLPGGKLLQSAEAVLISDVETLPEDSLLRRLGQQEGYRTVGLWPLVYQDRVIAAIGCYYDAVHQWSNAEQEVLAAFARQSAVALQNARLFSETRRRAAHLEALNAIITGIAAAPNLHDLLDIALDHTLRALGLQMGGIWVGEQSVLREFPADIGRVAATLPRPDRLDQPTAVVIDDWKNIPPGNELSGCRAPIERFGVRALLTVPILAEGRRIGCLAVTSSAPRQWLAEEIALIEGVGRQVGGAVERIELLERIQAHARQIQQIMDTVPEGVILLDERGQIVLANPAARSYLPTLAGANIGDRLTQLADQPIQQLLKPSAGKAWREITLPGPPRQFFEVAVQPVADADQSAGWVFVLRDVTQERENQARIQMQERLATVGQLAAGIAHDFNNIMAAIVVYTDLLKRDPHLPAASRDRLGIIQQQVQRAASLIRQILDFSRRSVMEQSTLDLLPFVKELDKLLGRVLPETIRLELTYQPGIYLVNADPTRLQQVFMNLAVNARDAMPEGGVLHFGLEHLRFRPEDRLPIADLPPGNWIRITVRDTGSGISPEVMSHIFEPFFTTKPVGQGTGLGLAQVYGIIKQHDGYISVESEAGKGATFQIYLRALEPQREELISPLETVESSGAGETILIVEDDSAAREALKALLEANNYRVLTAANGIEALQIFELRRDEIALVVSDVVMPHMGGVKLYHALRGRWPQVKILFITGHPLQEENQALLESGNVHWLQKPFAVSEFGQIVRKLVGW